MRRALAANGLAGEALCVELSEVQLKDHHARVIPQLSALRRLGVRIAIDDLGSAHSSFRLLRAVPVDVLKIDRSFVSGLLDEPLDRAIVTGIINVGRETSLDVIAEGVDTQALHSGLVALGCRLAQGYLYEEPKPPAELSLDRPANLTAATALPHP